jgi:hypothetical protein
MLPTRSLAFRLIDGLDAGAGIDGFIDQPSPDVDSLSAGDVVEARVQFPLARPGLDVLEGRRFMLWMGRPVGEAVVTAILSDSPSSPSV